MSPQPESAPVSIWQLKPWWCQPWSILLTGISLITGSWLVFHRIWVTGFVAVPVLAWMGFFLLLYPRLMLDMDQANETPLNHPAQGK